MFGQIIDFLIKQDEERRKIFILILKVVFTITIAAKIYLYLYGPFSILPINDFQGIVNYFFSGKAIICFVIFYLVWVISFDIISIILSSISLWLIHKICKLLDQILKTEPEVFKELIGNSTSLNKHLKKLRYIIKFLILIDVIEKENNRIKPGTDFNKLYDYLLDIGTGKKTISSTQFSSIISLIIQFIVIYNWFDFDFLSHSVWFFASLIIIIFFLFILNFAVYIFAKLINLKHKKLLKLLDKIKSFFQLFNTESEKSLAGNNCNHPTTT